MNASFVVKTPDLVRWNNVRMLGLRGREEQLNSKIQNFKDQVNYLECLTDWQNQKDLLTMSSTKRSQYSYLHSVPNSQQQFFACLFNFSSCTILKSCQVNIIIFHQASEFAFWESGYTILIIEIVDFDRINSALERILLVLVLLLNTFFRFQRSLLKFWVRLAVSEVLFLFF